MFKFIVFIAILKLASTFESTSDDPISLTLEDNAIDGKLSAFTKMNIRSSHLTSLEVVPSRTLSSQQYERLIEEFRLNAHSYYTLKVNFKHRLLQDYVMTSIPMCLVVQTRFQYTIDLFLNENGYIVSAHIATNNATCTTLNVSTLDTKNDVTYKVSLRLQSSDNGPQPEIQHFLDKLKREKEAKLNTDSDNRPFVLKYWKYLLPIVIIFLVQGAFPDGGSGGR
ncbi:unnamed protein product [Adineta ricciae]|uniref:ER membrane protein complex subunit 10 n=1 Tax=Adineta ricciae TaxID=249248 RepID=A0A814R757_ADIRI|nr:unnamed protein product [Adineta ricciae]